MEYIVENKTPIVDTTPEIAAILKSFDTYIEDALQRHSFTISGEPDSFEYIQENLKVYKEKHFALLGDLKQESWYLVTKFGTDNEFELKMLQESLTNAINKALIRFKEKSRGK